MSCCLCRFLGEYVVYITYKEAGPYLKSRKFKEMSDLMSFNDVVEWDVPLCCRDFKSILHLFIAGISVQNNWWLAFFKSSSLRWVSINIINGLDCRLVHWRTRSIVFQIIFNFTKPRLTTSLLGPWTKLGMYKYCTSSSRMRIIQYSTSYMNSKIECFYRHVVKTICIHLPSILT